MTKLGGAGGWFGDYLGVDCANLPSVVGRNKFTNKKFTKPNTQLSNSRHGGGPFISCHATFAYVRECVIQWTNAVTRLPPASS